jgi:Flp pilus assembly protein TadG
MAALIRRLRSFAKDHKGQALVEFAMVTPLFLFIFAGMADFALLFKSYQVSLNAAREGARLAVLPGYDAGSYATPKLRARDYMIAGGLTCSGCVLVDAPFNVALGGGVNAKGVRVRVQHTYTFLFVGRIVGLLNGTFQSNLPFEVSAIMRAEIQSSALASNEVGNES